MLLMTSASPVICEKLINHSLRTLIWRKAPKHMGPFTVYVYCTNADIYGDLVYTESSAELKELFGNIPVVAVNRGAAPAESVSCRGKVVASFDCAAIYPFKVFENGSIQDWNRLNLASAGLSYQELADYVGAGKTGYAVSVSNLTVFNTPMELRSFGSWVKTSQWQRMLPLRRPPTGYCYVHTIFDKRK